MANTNAHASSGTSHTIITALSCWVAIPEDTWSPQQISFQLLIISIPDIWVFMVCYAMVALTCKTAGGCSAKQSKGRRKQHHHNPSHSCGSLCWPENRFSNVMRRVKASERIWSWIGNISHLVDRIVLHYKEEELPPHRMKTSFLVTAFIAQLLTAKELWTIINTFAVITISKTINIEI